MRDFVQALIWLSALLLVIGALGFLAIQERNSIDQSFIEAKMTLNLPFKQVSMNSPVYTITAKNMTEFQQAIKEYNATTVYYTSIGIFSISYFLYVFRQDYIEATILKIP